MANTSPAVSVRATRGQAALRAVTKCFNHDSPLFCTALRARTRSLARFVAVSVPTRPITPLRAALRGMSSEPHYATEAAAAPSEVIDSASEGGGSCFSCQHNDPHTTSGACRRTRTTRASGTARAAGTTGRQLDASLKKKHHRRLFVFVTLFLHPEVAAVSGALCYFKPT